MTKKEGSQIVKILKVATLMALGLLVLKFLPMAIWGEDIQTDASMHITVACLALYVTWYFVDQEKRLHVPFAILSALVLFVVAIQRIEVSAHNDVGLLLGILVSVVSIYVTEKRTLSRMLDF